MNARKFLAAALLAGFAAAAPADSPRALTRRGGRALDEGRPDEALNRFAEAELAARAAGRDPASARFNQALALAELGYGIEAAERLEAAMETPDLNLQARAQYALGTLLGRMADSAAAEGDWKEAAETYRRALRGFESALRLDPADEDARINHELARARLEEARRLLEQEPKPEPEQEPEPGEDEGEQEEEPEPGPPGDPDDPAETPDTEPDPGPDEAPDAAEPEPGPPGDPDPRPLGEPEDGMTEEEARVILDALREREEAYRERARLRRGEPEPVEKDW